MGSFATSLHVKSNDANRVAATLAEILTEAGWRPTEKVPDSDAQWGLPSTLRAMQVSAPREEWVSILDTDLAAAQLLTPGLAKQLATHAIFFFVSDSDSWSYLLADPKGRVSEYDSDEGAEDDDFDEESLEHLEELAQRAAKLREIMSDPGQAKKLQDVGEQMLAAAPPEIREIQAKMQRGKTGPADVQRYHAWSMQQMPKYTAWLNELLGMDDHPTPPKPKKKKPKRKPTRAEQRAQQKRLDQLRPLLAAGVKDEQVQAVLDRQAVFAEDVVGEFLRLLGIADFYANLSYRYLSEAGPGELAAHNIRFAHHLRFETNTPPQLAVS
jgi:hypothetical protein